MKKTLFYIGFTALALTACMSNGNKEQASTEIVIRESELAPSEHSDIAIDTPPSGPFYKLVTFQKMDDNGGYEEYRLTMNLYEPNVPDEQGTLTHGTLALYVKTPENTEGIKVAQRIIDRVKSLDNLSAVLEMASSGEKPTYFDATLTYDSIAHTYQLNMQAPTQLEDLIENKLILQ